MLGFTEAHVIQLYAMTISQYFLDCSQLTGILATILHEVPFLQSSVIVFDRTASPNVYEAMVIIAWLLALAVLVITCMDREFKDKTFLVSD